MSIKGEKGVKREKKVHEFHFRIEIDLHYFFHATCALLDHFEIFAHFDHIFLPYFFALFDPSKWVGSVGPKIGIANTSI